jgi:hypothetical protein
VARAVENVSRRADVDKRGGDGSEDLSIGGIVDLVRDYAKQETLGPLKGAGKWLAFGAAGAVALGIGVSLLLLGLLRLLQTEWDRSSTGSLSWLAYVIVLAVCVVVIVVAVSRINKSSLNKEID